MEPLTIGYLGAGLLLVFLAMGIPVSVSMGVIGIGGMLLGAGPLLTMGQLSVLPFWVVNNYAFAVLPMFVLMGVLAESSGITTQIFKAADLWLRRFRGGLYHAVIVGSAVFAAISGSTIVNAVVFTRIAFPQMIKFGYSKSLSIGAIAGAGSFAAMIPPSITMVIYAIITEQSVGQLLIAGVIPGILTAIVYLGGVTILVRIKPNLAPPIETPATWSERWRAAGQVWPILILMILVMGGIYTGLFPPSAAGAAGAFGAFCLAVFKKRGIRGGWLIPALRDAASISCIIFVILIGGLLLSRMLVVVGGHRRHGVADHLNRVVAGQIHDHGVDSLHRARLLPRYNLNDDRHLAVSVPGGDDAGNRSHLVRHCAGQVDRDIRGHAAGGD